MSFEVTYPTGYPGRETFAWAGIPVAGYRKTSASCEATYRAAAEDCLVQLSKFPVTTQIDD